MSLSIVNERAAVNPKLTPVVAPRWLPIIVTDVPPVVIPLAGEILVMMGVGTYVNRLTGSVKLVPFVVVTVTLTAPLPTGDMALILLALTTTNDVAAVDPKLTALTLLKLVPLMITDVPPPSDPLIGAMVDTEGHDERVILSLLVSAKIL